MVLHLPSLPILLPLLFFISMTLKIVRTKSKAKALSSKTLPPGPWKLPIIGNIHNLLGSLPHHKLQDLAKKYGPIMHLQLGEITTIVISSPEIAKEIMKTHDIIFSNRSFLAAGDILTYNCTDLVFSPYGEYWRQLRKICILELLSAKRVQSFRSIREEEVLKLMRTISSGAGSIVNLTRMLFSFTYCVTTRAAFGKIGQEQEAFIPLVEEMNEVTAGFDIADVFPSIKLFQIISGIKARSERLHKEADKIFDNIIKDHKDKNLVGKIADDKVADDLVDVLLNLQNQGDFEFPLTINNIKAVILDLFVAGTETSATTSEWAMSEILKNPEVMEKAQEEVREVFNKKGYVDEAGIRELHYLKLVIKETLRLHPPLPLLVPRESREQCEINGYQVPIKSKVIINAWAIGRDSNHWTDAETFNPERFLDGTIDYKGTNFGFIPFGAGRRICPGISFGMANVELLLASLLYYFDWKLPTGMKQEELGMAEAFGAVARRENYLALIPNLCHPLPVA